MNELTDSMAHSILLCLETLKKQEEQIKNLCTTIDLLQKMSNNQEKRIAILREMVESQENKTNILKKIIEAK